MISLDRNLVIQIFRSDLSMEDWGRLRCVCKRFKEITESTICEQDWKNGLLKRFSQYHLTYGKLPLGVNFRLYYVKEVTRELKIKKAAHDYCMTPDDNPIKLDKFIHYAKVLLEWHENNLNSSHHKRLWRGSISRIYRIEELLTTIESIAKTPTGEIEYLIGRLCAYFLSFPPAVNFKRLYKAAESGFTETYIDVALETFKNIRYELEIDKETKRKARTFLQLAADSGNAKAQYHLAKHSGNLKYLIKAATVGGYPKAQNLFAEILMLDTNAVTSMITYYLESAAKQGCRRAMRNLAKRNEKDIEKAFNWAKLAAEREDADATFMLATYHEMGKGTPINLEEALRHYHLAANFGSGKSQYYLAQCYFTGNKTYFDQKRAVKYLKKATNQVDMQAHYILAYCLENGIGTEQNITAAYRHYKFVAKDYDFESERIAAENFQIDYVPSILKMACYEKTPPRKAARYYEIAKEYSLLK